ncbi:MAG: DNA primase [Chloroflexi bacterium]|nr:MAG: DNA primase [Chloroflexota bacterium]
MTNNSVIEQIKDRIDIVELIAAKVQLRKTGRSFVGFCPFHANTRTPAFTVYPESQSFHCFGCKASGTAFDYVMRSEGIEFREALELLAQRTGIELTPRTAQDDERDHVAERLGEINAAAARYFQHMLVKSPHGADARAYVAKRLINDWSLEHFQIGYALDERTRLFDYLTVKQNYAADEVVAAGLAIRRDDGSHYDRFRGRVMFPIRSAKGLIIAYGGRAMGDVQPKYLNSPQTLLFDKSAVLYGLDMAREAIRSQDAVVVVEGYVDVIALHQHGFRNVVAPLGTALTAEHVHIIKKLTKNIYLALDADTAGIKATIKGLQTLNDNLDATLVPVPTPSGVLSWSRTVEATIRIIELPDGQDPDELLANDESLWPKLVETALPAMDFYFQVLTRDLDLDQLPDKRSALDRLGPLIVQIGNQLEQTHYVQQLAHLLGVDETILRRELRRQAPTSRTKPTAPNVRPEQPAPPASRSAASPRSVGDGTLGTTTVAARAAEYLLVCMLNNSEIREAVQHKLIADLQDFPHAQECIASDVDSLFAEDDELREIWRARNAFGHDGDVLQWLATLPEPLRHRAEHLGRSVELPKEYLVSSEAMECVTIVQREIAKRWNTRLPRMLASTVDDAEADTLYARVADIQQYLNRLITPKRSSTFDDLHTRHSNT